MVVNRKEKDGVANNYNFLPFLLSVLQCLLFPWVSAVMLRYISAHKNKIRMPDLKKNYVNIHHHSRPTSAHNVQVHNVRIGNFTFTMKLLRA